MGDKCKYGIGRKDELMPAPEETRDYGDTLTTSAALTGSNEVVTIKLCSVDLDYLPTHRGTQAISASLPPIFSGLESPFIDNQPTWILPTMPTPGRAGSNVAEKRKTDSDTQDYLSLIRNMVKSSGIYALGSLASPLASLVLAPFLTHSLSHADYGALAIINVAIALVAGITQFGLGTAFFRAYNWDYESQSDRLNVLSGTVILLLLISIPTSVAMMIAAPWLAELLLNNPSFGDSMRLAALVVPLLNLTVPGFSWLRAEKRAVFSSILTITNLAVTLFGTLVLLGVFHMGVNGSLIAVGGGYGAVVVCTLPVIFVRAGLRLRFDIIKNLVFFGGPIIFTFLSAWVLQLSDRYLLNYFGSLVQTANYTVAYSLGGVLAPVILGPFGLAWPPVMYAIAKRDDAVHVFRLVFRWFCLVLFLAAFGLSLIAKLVLYILFPPTYHSVAPLIPIITLGIMFYGIYNFVTIGIYIQRKTSLTAILTAVAALVNVGLNIILIPLYGAMGAALSTFLAYALLALVAYIVNQRIYPIPFEVDIFIVGLLAGVTLYVGSSYLAQTQNPFIDSGISLIALILYGGCLALIGKPPVWRNK